jgi:hypothetical protein
MRLPIDVQDAVQESLDDRNETEYQEQYFADVETPKKTTAKKKIYHNLIEHDPWQLFGFDD